MAKKLTIVLTILLLAIAAYRGASILLSDPMLALANNYDMIRVQGCIKVYPVRAADVPPWSANSAAPIARYNFRYDTTPGCYFTTEVLFARMARPLFKAESTGSADGSFSLRWLGLVKLLIFFGIVLGFTRSWLRRGQSGAALLNALIVALVLMDPAITLYLNGFYAEYAVIIFGYASVAGAVLLMGRSSPPGIMSLSLLMLCVIALVCAKVQHAGLGLVIAILMGLPWLLRRERIPRLIGALAIGGIIGLAAQVVNLTQPTNQVIRLANLTSTVMMSLFPLSNDPYRTAEHIGLPRRCGAYVGLSWYMSPIRENAENHPCPEVAQTSYARLLGLAVVEPVLFVRFVGGGLQYLRPWIPTAYLGSSHLGVVEGQFKASLPEGWFSWNRLLDRAPLWLIYVLVVGPSIVAAIILFRRIVASNDLTSLLTVLAIAPYPVILSVLFGNGYADAAKQMHLVFVLVLSFWVLCASLVAAWAWRCSTDMRKRLPQAHAYRL